MLKCRTHGTNISTKEEPDTRSHRLPPHEAYFAAAQVLMPGARLLADAPLSESAAAHALLSGQILECTLKAFLSKVGVSETELKEFGLRHNLSELCRRAETKGLPITAIPAEWVETLNNLHDYPYRLRYLKEKKEKYLGGLVLPDAQITMSELTKLLEMVHEKIGLQDS